MSEYEPEKNLNIEDDTFLLEKFKEKMSGIAFIRKSTQNLIDDLKEDIELHLQTDQIVDVWNSLIGDAIIFLKTRDARERYHDQMTLGLEKLNQFLEKFLTFEPILYGGIPNYRDHTAHVLRVYLLGQHVINKAIGFENVAPHKKDLKISPEEKEAIWCILALTHDLGYPLEVIHLINQEVRSMLRKFGNIPVQESGYSYFTQFGSVNDFTVRFLSSDIINSAQENNFVTHLQAKYYQKFLSALSNFDHGMVTCTLLMKELVFFKESDYMLDNYKFLESEDARQFLIRKEILRSIASHSCQDIYYLGIKNFPFLLTVFDEMQEWGRPRLVDITKRGGSETELKINEFSSKLVDYKITFSFPKKYKASPTEVENAQKEVRKYFCQKRDKWLNVLRSAVGGKIRDIELNFEVEDKTSKGKVKNYFLKHINPEKIDQSRVEC